MKRTTLRLLPVAILAVLVPLARGLHSSGSAPAPSASDGMREALLQAQREESVVRAERTVRMLRELHAGLDAMEQEPELVLEESQ